MQKRQRHGKVRSKHHRFGEHGPDGFHLHFQTAAALGFGIVARNEEHPQRKHHQVEDDVEDGGIEHRVLIEHGRKHREAQKAHVAEHHHEGMRAAGGATQIAIKRMGDHEGEHGHHREVDHRVAEHGKDHFV